MHLYGTLMQSVILCGPEFSLQMRYVFFILFYFIFLFESKAGFWKELLFFLNFPLIKVGSSPQAAGK